MKVLFISQWYPHRYDAMAGLFVQKHAEAASLFCAVKVLYVHADENTDSFEMEEKNHSNMSELIVYYPCKKNNPLYKITKSINYFRAYWKGYKQITKNGFTPDIVHANILTRTGFMAYLLKKWKGTPYVVTEHWSRYLPNRNTYKGTIRKFITQLVVRNAAAILPVSESLKKAMLAHNLKNTNYTVINNVVDNSFFKKCQIEARLKKRIIHVSCFDEQAKNICGILRATKELAKTREDFELIIIGTGIDVEKVLSYSKTLDFPDGVVTFTGEKTPEEVADWMQNSDFFVLFSNYENSPVVISECLVCGKPVISTNVGGISEHVNNTNGILIAAGDEKALFEKMNFLLDHFEEYDVEMTKQIAKEKFSYESVGNILTEIYTQSVK